MSGGKIQGDQPPRSRSARKDHTGLDNRKNRDDLPRSKTRTRHKVSDTQVIDESFGPPSTEHERPKNKPGERDPSGVAPGR